MMKNRIRVAVLIFEKEKLLLVKHTHPKSGAEWWVPPGGGLQEKETLFECAKREAWEETNLKVKIGKVAYLKQFIGTESGKNNIEVFVTATAHSGKLTIDNLKGMGGDEKFIKEVEFFSKEEMKSVLVFPEILKKEMWADKKKGFNTIRFLGVTDDSSTRPKTMKRY
jgi:8-oxo-dGTP diphosphatase